MRKRTATPSYTIDSHGNPVGETAASIRLNYLMAAKYYYYRAEGPNENLANALQRMQAHKIAQRMLTLNIPVPTPEEIHAAAADTWPAHKLHTL